MNASSDSFYRAVLDSLNDGVYFVDTNRKITYWNKAAERLTGYSAADVLGLCCADGILRHISQEGAPLCNAGCPLAQSIKDGKTRESEVFLHHREGHRVPVLVKTSPLHDEKEIIIGGVEVFSDNSALISVRKQIAGLQKMALIDELTQLGNRRFVEITLSKRIDEMKRYGWPFGVLFMDIDRFKSINDTYGHPVGDDVLKMVAKTVLLSLRMGDSVGRWGGDEFVTVVANVEERQLRAVAERTRMLVEKSSVYGETEAIQVSISIGATLVKRTDKAASLLKRADQLMYRSKLAGRNRVTMDSDKQLLSLSQL